MQFSLPQSPFFCIWCAADVSPVGMWNVGECRGRVRSHESIAPDVQRSWTNLMALLLYISVHKSLNAPQKGCSIIQAEQRTIGQLLKSRTFLETCWCQKFRVKSSEIEVVLARTGQTEPPLWNWPQGSGQSSHCETRCSGRTGTHCVLHTHNDASSRKWNRWM